MPTPKTCEAYQVSDQMSCPRCGLVWDMNDPEPPECGRVADLAMTRTKPLPGGAMVAATTPFSAARANAVLKTFVPPPDPIRAAIKAPWVVGWLPRGARHGGGSYCIRVGDQRGPIVCEDFEYEMLAQHIVDTHNATLNTHTTRTLPPT